MNNIIIKNNVSFLGNFDDVQEVLKKISSGESQLDFNKIEPMGKDLDDLALDDYMNLCLNVYANKKENKEELFNMFEFIGRTRRIPYEFHELSKEQLNSAKANYQTRKISKDTESFLDRVKNKSIFNGYMIRDALWGTGSGAMNAKKKDNRIEFITYDKAPITLFIKLSKQYPNIKIDYTYSINDKVTKVRIENGKAEFLVDENKDYKEPVLYTLITKNVCI